MSHCMHQRKGSGQAVVELALILPVLILVIVGILEFAILLSSYLVVQDVARDAVRQIVVGGDDAAVFQLVRTNAVGIDIAQLSFAVTPIAGSRQRGDAVTVTATYNHRILTPVLSTILGQTLQWQVTATMRYE